MVVCILGNLEFLDKKGYQNNQISKSPKKLYHYFFYIQIFVFNTNQFGNLNHIALI